MLGKRIWQAVKLAILSATLFGGGCFFVSDAAYSSLADVLVQ